MKRDIQDALTKSIANAPPTFHPVHERDPGAWFPGNNAASLLIHISHTWEDILRLSEICRRANDAYDKKLLFKYILVELRSLLMLLDKLQPIILKAPTFGPNEKPAWRSISQDEMSKAKKLFKQYHRARSKVEADVLDVRNKIGAHRDTDSWQEIIKLWDKLSPESFLKLFESIPPLFEHIKDLDLYEWNRIPGGGGIEILGSRIYPDSL